MTEKENRENGDWHGKRLTVVGAGVSGRELALLAARLGAQVFVTEKKPVSPENQKLFEENGIGWEGGGHTDHAYNADAMLLSSGLPLRARIVQDAEWRGVPMIGELDFVLPHLSGIGTLIGVTGSNGKSTVTALLGHMMERMGWKSAAGGNLGTASASFADSRLDGLALELSSFQLARAAHPAFHAVVVTNLAPDHIDWHGSYENYVAAKANLLSLRLPGGWAVVQDRDVDALKAQDMDRVVTLSWKREPSHKMAGHIFMGEDEALLTLDGTSRPLFRYDETSLLGSHNLENVAMALAVLRLLGREDPAAKLLEGFSPLPHRCENVGTVDGVLYVDDSKGTNVAAAVTAMTAIRGRKVVILGGRGKGEDYAPLAEGVKREADAAVLLGEEAPAIAHALAQAGFTAMRQARDMEEAVSLARELAHPGMTVLLSPACTSWDMYDNYGQRGDHFRALVRGLQ